MAKKIQGYLKLQVPAGAANPSPPIGPALGQRGLNIMEFCKAFKRQDAGNGKEFADSGDHYHLPGQVLHLRDEDVSCFLLPEKSCKCAEGFFRTGP